MGFQQQVNRGRSRCCYYNMHYSYVIVWQVGNIDVNLNKYHYPNHGMAIVAQESKCQQQTHRKPNKAVTSSAVASCPHLELHRQLWRVLQRPQRSNQRRQMLGHVSPGRLPLVGSHLAVEPIAVHIRPVLFQTEVLRQQVRVAETLDHGVHEAGVPVVLKSQHPGSLVSVAPRQPLFHRAVRRGQRGGLLCDPLPGDLRAVLLESPRRALPKAAVVLLRVRRHRVSKVRQSAQSFQDPSHEIPQRSKRFLPGEPPAFIFLLLSLARLWLHCFPYLVFLAGLHGSVRSARKWNSCTCLPDCLLLLLSLSLSLSLFLPMRWQRLGAKIRHVITATSPSTSQDLPLGGGPVVVVVLLLGALEPSPFLRFSHTSSSTASALDRALWLSLTGTIPPSLRVSRGLQLCVWELLFRAHAVSGDFGEFAF